MNMKQIITADQEQKLDINEGVSEENTFLHRKMNRLLSRLSHINLLFAVTVFLPTILATAYFGFLANDVYVSESRFVVRSPSKASVSPLGVALGSAGLTGASEESNAVTEYLVSRRALQDVNSDGLITQAYTGHHIFAFDRFGGIWGESQEELYTFFLDKIAVSEGSTTQVTRLTVRAYKPEEAQAINARLLEQAEELVNGLSQRGQSDAIAIANEEVDEARALTRNAALQLSRFRDKERIIDPEAQAEARLQMISKLQDELIASRTQLRQLQTYTPQASQIPFLRTQVAALQDEIEEQMSEIAGGNRSLSATAARYQELQLNSQFAEQQLAIALASLQDAQAEARRKRAYVDRISDPSLPDYASEPRRLRSIIATFVLGLLLWGVLSMLLVGVREHRD